jgi:hypothetical protein
MELENRISKALAAAVVDAAAFETTNTSTGWPGSKAKPCGMSSPWSPTVVSLPVCFYAFSIEDLA